MPCENRTPIPVFEPETGFLVLTDGRIRQVVLRFEWPNLHLYWKKGKEEIPLSVGDFFHLVSA